MENNILEYKGYFAKVFYSVEDNVLHGKIEGIADLITFESENCNDIEASFQSAVDDYLEFCQEVGKSPEKPYKGSFNIRITPELHRRADIAAKKQGVTLNQFVADSIASYLNGAENRTIIYYPIVNWKLGVENSTTNYMEAVMPKFNAREVTIAWQS